MHYWFISYGDFAEWLNFACVSGVHWEESAQQACFVSFFYIFFSNWFVCFSFTFITVVTFSSSLLDFFLLAFLQVKVAT